MKIYHVCEYCDAVFDIENKSGPYRNQEVKGICNGCAQELGFMDSGEIFQHFYH